MKAFPEAGAIVVAAGASRRMEGREKVFYPLGGKPLLAHCLEALEAVPAIGEIVLVLAQENLDRGRRLMAEGGWRKLKHICPGGPRRQDSVAEGLKRLGPWEWALVHDGTRPLVTPELITGVLAAARETGAAIAAVPVKGTIKEVASGLVLGTPPRERLWAAQTPQAFRLELLRRAYASISGEVTDDASLVEALGVAVKVHMGSYANIKVTTPEDLALAEALLKQRLTEA